LQVLHIDRNNYYGGQSASLNLNQVRRRWPQAAAGDSGLRCLALFSYILLLQCAVALDIALQWLIAQQCLCWHRVPAAIGGSSSAHSAPCL
jgi:RAB protein geranylgeranyltransferase component A